MTKWNFTLSFGLHWRFSNVKQSVWPYDKVVTVYVSKWHREKGLGGKSNEFSTNFQHETSKRLKWRTKQDNEAKRVYDTKCKWNKFLTRVSAWFSNIKKEMELENKSSDETNTDDERKKTQNQPKEKKQYKQKFCHGWLSNPNFKDWIQEKTGRKGSSVPYCSVCKVKLSCSKTALSRHGEGKGHKEALKMNAQLSKSQPNIGTLLGSSEESVAKLEIKLCCFIVENNLPIHLSEDLLALLSSLFPLDKNAQKATLGKRKATNIIRQVLGFNLIKKAIAQLRSWKFSLIIGEKTNRSCTNQLAQLATYFNPDTFKLPQFIRPYSNGLNRKPFQWGISLVFALTHTMLCFSNIILLYNYLLPTILG